MNRKQYMEELKIKLKRLPKEDYEKAIEYYEEYFDEAGAENEQQAIEDLGNPRDAADQIIREFATDNERQEEAKKDMKKGISGVWIAILAICASPIALPILIVVVTLLFTFVIVIVSLFLSFGFTGVALVLTAPVVIIGAFTMLLKSAPVFLVCLGVGMISLALGVLIVYASYVLLRKFFYWIIVLFNKMLSDSVK